MSDEMDVADISKLKVPDLKKQLKNRGLSTTGNKNELVERLQRALKSKETIDDMEEDLLNDDDDDDEVHLSESGILDQDLEESPATLKRKLPTVTKEEKNSTEPPKKVILNRKASLSIPKPKPAPVAQPVVKKDKIEFAKENKSSDDDEKKVVKLSEISVKERLELRAKKFGVTALNDDVKKLVRAERFAITHNNKNSSESISKLTEATSIDVLKKRAERFGGSVSSLMSTAENKEKLEKRKERFGTTISSGKAEISTDEAKKARAERFKTNLAK